MSHKHNYVIKTTNRLEYWFTCDNCGKDVMISKWDFWDLKHYEKQALMLKEQLESWAKEMKRRSDFWSEIRMNETVYKSTLWERVLEWLGIR